MLADGGNAPVAEPARAEEADPAQPAEQPIEEAPEDDAAVQAAEDAQPAADGDQAEDAQPETEDTQAEDAQPAAEDAQPAAGGDQAEEVALEELSPQEVTELEGAEALSGSQDAAVPTAADEKVQVGRKAGTGAEGEKTANAKAPSLAQTLAAQSGLEAQVVTNRTLSLNGEWHTFYPAGYGTGNGCIYTFTLSKNSRVELVFQNWSKSGSTWELYDADMTHRFLVDYIYDDDPGNGSDYCYLKAGTYRLRVYSNGGNSGYMRVKGTATPYTAHPTRNIDTFDKALSMKKDTSYKTLFTRNDVGDHYYKFTVSGTKTVKITYQESDAKLKTLNYLYLYNADKEQVMSWGCYDIARSVTKELTGGTYYVKLQQYYKNAGGPYTIKWTAISDTVADASVNTPSYSYTGNAIAPKFTVKLNGSTLREGVDYTVSYGSATNSGWYNATIRGTGSYKGSKTVQFQIKKASVAGASVSGVYNRVYTGKGVGQSPTVKVGGRTLKRGTDYTLSYKNNVRLGTATMTITGKGNYTGSASRTFKIVRDVRNVQYYVHRQTKGNEPAWSRSNGQSSGTVGESKRLEAIWIRLGSKPVSGSIQYRTHVQTYGWQGWKSDGAMSGTSGQSKRLEAIQIRLTGAMAANYDVYYRVHAQTYGWMGWAKNGRLRRHRGLRQAP